jgi:hypothetical protein
MVKAKKEAGRMGEVSLTWGKKEKEQACWKKKQAIPNSGITLKMPPG